LVFDDESERGAANFRLEYENAPPQIVGPLTVHFDGESYNFRFGTLDPDFGVPIPGFELLSLDIARADVVDKVVSGNGMQGFTVDLSLLQSAFGVDVLVDASLRAFDRAGAGDSVSIQLFLGTPAGLELYHAVGAVLSSGSPVTLSQVVDTPASPFTFQFDYLFETLAGELLVTLGGETITSIAAPGSLDPFFTTVVFLIDDASLLDLIDAELAFTFDGPTGSSLMLDNILFPGVENGRFDTGDLSGWTVLAEGAATAGVKQFEVDISVPEPGTLALAALGCMALLCFGERRTRTWWQSSRCCG
jgi:hypothetical protein